MPQKSNNSKTSESGVMLSFRLSETLLAVILTAGLSFGGGFAIANKQNVNCSVQNTSIPQHK